MADEKKKKTLFQVVKPLIFLFNHLYGLNIGNRKPPTCVQRVRRRLQKLLVFLICFDFLVSYCLERYAEKNSVFAGRGWLLVYAFGGCFYLFVFNEPEMERLIRRLKKHSMGKWSEKAISKMTVTFLLALLLFFCHPFMIMYELMTWSAAGTGYGYSAHATVKCGLILSAVVFLLFFFSMLVFPVFNAFLSCVLVSYCPSRLDDHVEDILRAHSPLRRARLLSKLCYDYYKLQPLASMTNRNTATTMSLVKVFTMFLWVVCLHLLEENDMKKLFNIPFLQYSVPLLVYLRVAPSANDMKCKVFNAAREVLMVDDQWAMRDPISRALLIKLRLNLLKHLVHMEMDQGPFTLLGDSVDPENLFMIFVEVNDLRTVLI